MRPLVLRSANFGSSLIMKWNQRTSYEGYGTIDWWNNPRSDSSCLEISCEAVQQWRTLLVKHQTYLNNVILVSITLFSTIQGLIPTLMMKVGILSNAYAFLTGLEVICVIGYWQNQAHWFQRQLCSMLQDMICLIPRLQHWLKNIIQL